MTMILNPLLNNQHLYQWFKPPKKPPSKFFKSKSAPVVSNPAPLRPLEVTPNQPLKQSLPPAKPPAKAPLKEPPKPKVEEFRKVAPLKIRLKAGTLTQPPPLTPLPPPEPPAPVIQETVEEEEEDDYTASSDNNSIDNNSVADDNDAEEEISFKEPSLVIPSPPKSKSPSRLTSPLGQHNFQQPQAATPSPPRSTLIQHGVMNMVQPSQHGVLNIVPPSQHGVKNSSRVSSHSIDPARNDQ